NAADRDFIHFIFYFAAKKAGAGPAESLGTCPSLGIGVDISGPFQISVLVIYASQGWIPALIFSNQHNLLASLSGVEVDHWNNERERVVVITDANLLVCKYDFIMLSCLQVQRIPLNYIDRICCGQFIFPERSLDKREGEGLRIYWDNLKEPSALSRWNPWATDIPYATFTEHPVKNSSERFSAICQLSEFTAQLIRAIQTAQSKNPAPGKTSGVVVLNQPLLIDTYMGFMSFIGNRNKLGYSLARGSVGF
uniref:Tumor protein p63 regulated 1 n=1 Tax=Gopherus evgoodei TaxID=1825980 RepID=A0A8C5EZE6_9SAUR